MISISSVFTIWLTATIFSSRCTGSVGKVTANMIWWRDTQNAHLCQPVENTAASLTACLCVLWLNCILLLGLCLLPVISRSHQARVELGPCCCLVKPVGGDHCVSEWQRTTRRCLKLHGVQCRGLLVHVSTSVHSQQRLAQLQSAQRSIWIIKLLASRVGG